MFIVSKTAANRVGEGRPAVIQAMVSLSLRLGDLESLTGGIMSEGGTVSLNNNTEAESLQTEGRGAEDTRVHFTKGSFSTVVLPAPESALRSATVQVSPPLT